MIAFTAAERRRTCAVALLFVVLTMLLAYPLSVRAANRVMSASPDTNLFMWTLAWDVHAFTHQPIHIFDANIYYPMPRTLAYSENLISGRSSPRRSSGHRQSGSGGEPRVSAVLCAPGCCVLRASGLGVGASVVSGLVYGFSPPRFLRLDQLHLTTIQWVPFGLASLHAYLDEGRPFALRLTAAFFTLQALSSGHGVVFLLLATIGLVVFRIATGDRIDIVRLLRDFGIVGVLLVAPALLAFGEFHRPTRRA